MTRTANRTRWAVGLALVLIWGAFVVMAFVWGRPGAGYVTLASGLTAVPAGMLGVYLATRSRRDSD